MTFLINDTFNQIFQSINDLFLTTNAFSVNFLLAVVENEAYLSKTGCTHDFLISS
jgi:hypothetical protein